MQTTIMMNIAAQGCRRAHHFYLNLSIGALALVGAALPALAATQSVTNTNDSGPGSLRDVIAAASPGDTIQFSVTGTIILTSGELLINKNLIITGPGASQLALSGNHASRVFEISSGVPVALSGLMIENGSADSGGGILNAGTLTVTDSVISNNSVVPADGGGGVYNTGTLTVTNSTISGNFASDANGGGINNLGTATVTNSTISGNSAGPAYGGGLINSGILTLINSTISGNSALFGDGLVNSGTLTVKGTLLASNNSGGISPGNCDLFRAAVSLGYNLSDDNTCASAFTAPGDLNNVVTGAGLDPKGLQNNGGPTPTIALLPNSPAVDYIPIVQCTDPQGHPIPTDQRGIPRPQGAGCDVGAFELVKTVPFSAFQVHLALFTGRRSGFVLTSRFTLGAASQGLQPQTEAVTLQIANYTVTLPAGSLHPLWDSPDAPYVYEGTINGTHLAVELRPVGENRYEFEAAGFPVAGTDLPNPVTVSLTIGGNTGSTTVDAYTRPE